MRATLSDLVESGGPLPGVSEEPAGGGGSGVSSSDWPDGVVGGETPGPRIPKPPGRVSSVPIATSSELGFFLQLLMAETASGLMTGQSDRASPCVQVSMIS